MASFISPPHQGMRRTNGTLPPLRRSRARDGGPLRARLAPSGRRVSARTAPAASLCSGAHDAAGLLSQPDGRHTLGASSLPVGGGLCLLIALDCSPDQPLITCATLSVGRSRWSLELRNVPSSGSSRCTSASRVMSRPFARISRARMGPSSISCLSSARFVTCPSMCVAARARTLPLSATDRRDVFVYVYSTSSHAASESE